MRVVWEGGPRLAVRSDQEFCRLTSRGHEDVRPGGLWQAVAAGLWVLGRGRVPEGSVAPWSPPGLL